MFFTCMLYSCLVDADFLDTEAFMVREAARELFMLLEKEGAFHPATLMYPAHRQSRRKGIRRMLKAAAPFPGSVD